MQNADANSVPFEDRYSCLSSKDGSSTGDIYGLQAEIHKFTGTKSLVRGLGQGSSPYLKRELSCVQ